MMEQQPGTTLVIDELILRPWRSTDVAALLAACGDPEIARWAGLPQPFGPDDAEAFMETHGRARGYQREGVLRAWDVLDDGLPVDCVVYSRLRSDP